MKNKSNLVLNLDYTNWRGERTQGEVCPIEITHAATEYYPTKQWLLRGYDLKQGAEHQHAIKDMHSWSLQASPISHQAVAKTLEEATDKARARILARGDLAYGSVDRQLGLLRELATCDVGCFLLQHAGLDGYWTDYIVNKRWQTEPETEAEAFILKRWPLIHATRERVRYFQQALNQHVRDGMRIASIPCGLMRDFAAPAKNVERIGIDLDFDTLLQAANEIKDADLKANTRLRIANAWELDEHEQYDLISSNGIVPYESDDERVTDLYRIFWRALKPGGVLTTSFITPPDSEWKMDLLNPDDLAMQRLLFSDIIGATWQSYRTSEQTTAQLKAAGFANIELKYDRAHTVPTAIAHKGASGYER